MDVADSSANRPTEKAVTAGQHEQELAHLAQRPAGHPVGQLHATT
jgi:hypothetical protein